MSRGAVLDVSDSNLYKNGIVPSRGEVEWAVIKMQINTDWTDNKN